MVTAAHQAELDLVLHIFNVESTAARARTHQCADHRLGQAINGFTNAGRGRTLRAMHSQKGFHHGDRDLVGLKRNDGTVAANDLVLAVRRGGGLGFAACSGCALAGWQAGCRLDAGVHEFPKLYGLCATESAMVSLCFQRWRVGFFVILALGQMY